MTINSTISQSVDGITDIPSKFLWKPTIDDVKINISDMATDITPRQLPGYSQITSTIGMDIVLTKPINVHSYAYYRTLREYPVIKLTRNIILGALLNAEWMISDGEDAPAGASELLECLIDNREEMLEPIMMSLIDYGFHSSETMWGKKNGSLEFRGIKQLIPDMVWIVTHGWSGKYLGLRELYLAIPAIKTLMITHQQEGTQFYGVPWIHGAAWHYEQMLKSSESRQRYSRLVAGAFREIKYPKGVDSIGCDNGVRARQAGDIMKAGGTVYVEKDWTPEALANASKEAIEARSWEFNIKGDQSQRQHSFIEEEEYLDRMMIMGCSMPVRAILESSGEKYGSSSDSEQHSNLALSYVEYYHKKLTKCINKQIVDVLLEMNYGPDAVGTIKLLTTPIHDDSKILFQDILKKGLDNPNEFAKIDHQEIRDRFHIPENENPEPSIEVDAPGNTNTEIEKEEIK